MLTRKGLLRVLRHVQTLYAPLHVHESERPESAEAHSPVSHGATSDELALLGRLLLDCTSRSENAYVLIRYSRRGGASLPRRWHVSTRPANREVVNSGATLAQALERAAARKGDES